MPGSRSRASTGRGSRTGTRTKEYRDTRQYIAQFEPDLRNRDACNRHAAVRAFIGASRLEGFTRVMRAVKPEEAEPQAVIARLRDASKRAAENLPRLLETL